MIWFEISHLGTAKFYNTQALIHLSFFEISGRFFTMWTILGQFFIISINHNAGIKIVKKF
jgi:hypothetical protein